MRAGTTWMQQIIGQLIFNGQEDVPVSNISLWLDLRVPPKEIKYMIFDGQTHRRFIKTHLPVDALGINPKLKYIYVARDGRDVLWSCFNFH
jgi:aryl sulfotransferase